MSQCPTSSNDDQGVTAALAARDANRNGDDSHTSGTGTEGCGRTTHWFRRGWSTVFSIATALWKSQIQFSNNLKKEKCLTSTVRGMRIKLPEESDKVERYVGGLPDMIHGSVVASKPKTCSSTEMATELYGYETTLLLKRKLRSRGNLTTTTKLNNNFLRGRMWSKLMPLGLVKEKSMLELYRCATSASFTTMARSTVKCANCRGRVRMELEERSLSHIGKAKTIPDEVIRHLFTIRASSSNATSLSLEDKAHLTGGDYNTPCFRVIDVVNKSAMYLLVLYAFV
ncbi:hypothetical protein Tco_0137926 [Tanacetum coccineum]